MGLRATSTISFGRTSAALTKIAAEGSERSRFHLTSLTPRHCETKFSARIVDVSPGGYILHFWGFFIKSFRSDLFVKGTDLCDAIIQGQEPVGNRCLTFPSLLAFNLESLLKFLQSSDPSLLHRSVQFVNSRYVNIRHKLIRSC